MTVILHVDGDAFFASCEVASRPWLKGKPVVTGYERGIASSMSYEAKALGITRAMSVAEIRRTYPQVAVLNSDYKTYSIYSQRMCTIVRRHAGAVEEYSIDECFADITESVDPALREPTLSAYVELARRIKNSLDSELGITFSVGVSVNKVLAKAASKWQKPSGLTCINMLERDKYLASLPIHKIWGIGPSGTAELVKYGINTAGDFASRPTDWVAAHFHAPLQAIHAELCGRSVLHFGGPEEEQASVSRTGTFSPPSSDRAYLLAELSMHAEAACKELRDQGQVTRHVFFFLKSKDFVYFRADAKLSRPVNTPEDIVRVMSAKLSSIFRKGILYRATGVTLSSLSPEGKMTGDIFSQGIDTRLYRAVDALSRKYGKDMVFLGSSLTALREEIREGQHGRGNGNNRDIKNDRQNKHTGIRETARPIMPSRAYAHTHTYKHWAIPFLGFTD